MLQDWVGCGTFSVVVSVLFTVLMILVCLVLLRVYKWSHYSTKKQWKFKRAKCTQTWVHCVKLDFRWILVLVSYFSEVVWISYEFLKFKLSLKMKKGWLILGWHVSRCDWSTWHADISMTSLARLWADKWGPADVINVIVPIGGARVSWVTDLWVWSESTSSQQVSQRSSGQGH